MDKLKNKILYHINPDLLEDLKAADAILAGGSILSIYMNTPISDFDIFFKSKEQNERFTDKLGRKYGKYGNYITPMGIEYVVPVINHSITLHKIDGLITDSLEYLFRTFDFTVCMGAYSFKEDKFYFHENFFKDVKNKHLKINYESPSLLRISGRLHKYFNKGFLLHEKEYLKLKVFLLSTPYSELFKRYNDFFEFYDDMFISYSCNNSIHIIDWVKKYKRKDKTYGYSSLVRFSHRLQKGISKNKKWYKY